MKEAYRPLLISFCLFAKVGLLFFTVSLSCSEPGDSYATGTNHGLSFSADTLSFDTVFTTIGSATRQIMVYNTNKASLMIESVRLTNGRQSGFRLNVDGRSGESFSRLRISGNDSLYVFVEVTVNPTGGDSPLRIEDFIEFTVNGKTQTVCLQAYGQDVRLYRGGVTVAKDTLWTAERPYLLYDSLVIDSGATLTVEKGASFYMHDKAKWVINGRLRVVGTLEDPVTFRGDRLDNLLTDIPYDRMANQWDGLYFGSGSFGNVMDYAVVRNANQGLHCAASEPEQMKIRLSNSQITNMEQVALSAVNCRIEAVNTEFSNARGHILSLSGGDYHFIHCTAVNYYVFSPGRQGLPVLALKAEKDLPLKAVFDNSIIDGSYSEGDRPLRGELSIDGTEGAKPSFRFNHCAVKTVAADDSAFVHVRFINRENPVRYRYIGSIQDNVFDFRLDTCQTAIGWADPDIAARYPLDRFGTDRTLSEDGPDIGAYEYIPEPPKEAGRRE
jgi:hypothetical protein